MQKVCYDVQVEHQQIATDHEVLVNQKSSFAEHPRLDMSGRGIWTQSTVPLSIRMTHPNCQSNQEMSLKSIYKQHEKSKTNTT